MLFHRVPGDTSQESPEDFYIGQPIDGLEGPQEDLLGKIVNGPQVRAYRRHIGPQLPLVPPDQFGQCFGLAAPAGVKGNVYGKGHGPVWWVGLPTCNSKPYIIMIPLRRV